MMGPNTHKPPSKECMICKQTKPTYIALNSLIGTYELCLECDAWLTKYRDKLGSSLIAKLIADHDRQIASANIILNSLAKS